MRAPRNRGSRTAPADALSAQLSPERRYLTPTSFSHRTPSSSRGSSKWDHWQMPSSGRAGRGEVQLPGVADRRGGRRPHAGDDMLDRTLLATMILAASATLATAAPAAAQAQTAAAVTPAQL